EGIQKAGLLGNLDTVELTYKPFVSIHVATYNEKRVVQRLLIACTSQDYPNYEVVIADDSTDETVGILEKWKDHPKVKIVHRSDRTGFKGGALKYALEQTDPRAEFVIIFDADFIPYSDTITQFMKYFKVSTGKLDAFQDYKDNNIAAIQGYQWHVLNKSENWLTRGVRSEFAGSYVMERSGSEIFGGLKMIAGSVYMIRRDVLQAFSWGTSITEDFELTLRIYEAGFKVVYTPYVQAPSECVSTVKRLIRQRMRWAEGHSFNVKQMFWRLLKTPYMSVNEKLEFLYLSPYYLQSFFFIVGTVSWLVSEVVFHAKLPFWTVLWGWSLVFSNMLSLPLMNSVGLFLEEAEERDYFGVASFFIMSYVLIPFQAYASIKGFLESEEGGWFRTPKSGKITDTFTKGKFYRWFRGILGWRTVGVAQQAIAPAYSINGNSAHNVFQSFDIRPQKARWIGKVVLTALLVFTLTIYSATKGVPLVYAENPTGPFYLRDESSGVLTGTSAEWRVADNSADTTDSTSTVASVNNKEAAPKWYQYKPGTTNLDEETGTSCSANTPDNAGWIFEMPFGVGGDIASGTWTFYFNEVDDRSGNVGTLEVCVWRVSVSGGVITASTLLYGTDSDGSWPTTDIWDAAVTNTNYTTGTVSQLSLGSDEYLYVEYFTELTTISSAGPATEYTSTFRTGPTYSNPRIVIPTITIPERLLFFLPLFPLVPFLSYWMKKKTLEVAR
ncbi:MAG TPA: glycosyltransferase family 2 protein, partial [Patescibacteria group bacterium]|nr:glycosyltransferase family 2 protein [Patescibacteria group bacterium]